jgi:hypothetical protein
MLSTVARDRSGRVPKLLRSYRLQRKRATHGLHGKIELIAN